MHLGAILFDEVKEESVLVTPVCRSLLSAVPLVCRSFRRWQLFVYHRTFILNAGLKKPKSGDSATLRWRCDLFLGFSSPVFKMNAQW